MIVKPTTRFKKDYKRYKHDEEKIKLLESIVKMLENEQEIPSRFRPHPLFQTFCCDLDVYLILQALPV